MDRGLGAHTPFNVIEAFVEELQDTSREAFRTGLRAEALYFADRDRDAVLSARAGLRLLSVRVGLIVEMHSALRAQFERGAKEADNE